MYVDPTGYTEAYLKEMVNAAGGSVVWDKKKRVANVTVNGKKVKLDPNKYRNDKGSIVMDSEEFDKMFTFSNKKISAAIHTNIKDGFINVGIGIINLETHDIIGKKGSIKNSYKPSNSAKGTGNAGKSDTKYPYFRNTTIKASPKESGWDKFKKIVEVEAGYGAGLGASVKVLNVINAEVGGYVDRINFKYEDGRGSLGSKVSAGLNVEALKVVKGVKVGADYEVTNDMFNSQYNDPLVGITSDPNSQKEWSYGVQVGNKSIGANSDGNIDYKIAIGVSAAVGIAGQVEFRINLTHTKEFWDYLWDR